MASNGRSAMLLERARRARLAVGHAVVGGDAVDGPSGGGERVRELVTAVVGAEQHAPGGAAAATSSRAELGAAAVTDDVGADAALAS